MGVLLLLLLTVRKQRFLKIQILETYKMPSIEILRIINCIHITVILHFHLVNV